MGFTARGRAVAKAGIASSVFAEVEPEPSLQTVRKGAALMADYQPDWIIGLGSGSAMDAAKSMWALYEQPEIGSSRSARSSDWASPKPR